MKLLRNIISVFLAIAITISLSAPAFALDPGVIVGAMEVAPDFGSWLWSGIKGGASIIGSFITDDICSGGGENPGLNARHEFVPQHTLVNGKTGMFYVCKNCQKTAGEVLEPAYDDYVQTLPANGYTSTGGLLWSPDYSYLRAIFSIGSNRDYFCSHYGGSGSNISALGSYSYTCGCGGSGHFSLSLISGESSRSLRSLMYCFSGAAPVSGTYTLQSGPGFSVSYGSNGGELKQASSSFSSEKSVFYAQGTEISKELGVGIDQSVSALTGSCALPVYSVVPSEAFSSNTYNTNTRPTSITGGNYGIVGDNGQITKVEDNSTIVNETNNTFYNPATGQTVPISNWSYDYSDRSYNVTTESGDTVTVTYGDENITIKEGDTTYNIYYLIQGTGSENPPAACTHNWQETGTTPATCTMSGSRTLTCSLCSQTKSESIPVLGHDWQVKQSVTTEYDDTGQLVQEGYTIYECSRCHEQYRAASGSSPPVNPSDPDASGEGVFSGIFGLLLDFLSFFWKTFKDFTKSGVKAFLEALQDGTSDIFGLLNPFDWSA